MSAETTTVIQKTNYSHEKVIEALIENPRITQGQLAARFGYTPGWMSQVMRSDAFREMYERRRKELVDPTILLSLEERFNAATHRALDILIDDLDARKNPEIALKVLSEGRQALGLGVAKGPTVQANFVVAMPAKAENAEDWLSAHKPRVIEANPTPEPQVPAGPVTVNSAE